jgi:hypothetical protein
VSNQKDGQIVRKMTSLGWSLINGDFWVTVFKGIGMVFGDCDGFSRFLETNMESHFAPTLTKAQFLYFGTLSPSMAEL